MDADDPYGRYEPWSRWFAWRPVRINYNVAYPKRYWVWWQTIERSFVCCHGGCMWYYRPTKGAT